jgi:hypothetical protein
LGQFAPNKLKCAVTLSRNEKRSSGESCHLGGGVESEEVRTSFDAAPAENAAPPVDAQATTDFDGTRGAERRQRGLLAEVAVHCRRIGSLNHR